MMPYDIDSNFIYTPKFYQALCHELFHAQVSDWYKSIKRIDEGLPEIYSELCYYLFLKKLISGHVGNQLIDNFEEKYMEFTRHGSYHKYYESVKKDLGFIVSLDRGFGPFYDFIYELLQQTKIQISGHKDLILECGDKTPEWLYVYETARITTKNNWH